MLDYISPEEAVQAHAEEVAEALLEGFTSLVDSLKSQNEKANTAQQMATAFDAYFKLLKSLRMLRSEAAATA